MSDKEQACHARDASGGLGTCGGRRTELSTGELQTALTPPGAEPDPRFCVVREECLCGVEQLAQLLFIQKCEVAT